LAIDAGAQGRGGGGARGGASGAGRAPAAGHPAPQGGGAPRTAAPANSVATPRPGGAYYANGRYYGYGRYPYYGYGRYPYYGYGRYPYYGYGYPYYPYYPYYGYPGFSVGFSFGWGYPYYYGYGAYGYPYAPAAYVAPGYAVSTTFGGVRIQGAPPSAEVYVDGQYAGVVDDFNGTFERLNLEAGTHSVEIRTANGGQPIAYDVNITPGQTVNIHTAVKK
jgi:hypothetical protein